MLRRSNRIAALPVPHPPTNLHLQSAPADKLRILTCSSVVLLPACLPARLWSWPVPDLYSSPVSLDYLPALDKLFTPVSCRTYCLPTSTTRLCVPPFCCRFYPLWVLSPVGPLLSTSENEHSRIGVSGMLPACGLLQLLAKSNWKHWIILQFQLSTYHHITAASINQLWSRSHLLSPPVSWFHHIP